jgi:PAT family beta-lactamase induction signal transducer AmpG
LLSSLSSVGRVWIGPMAGEIAHHYGWITYFLTSVVISIPGLVLLLIFKDGLENMMVTQALERETVSSSGD